MSRIHVCGWYDRYRYTSKHTALTVATLQNGAATREAHNNPRANPWARVFELAAVELNSTRGLANAILFHNPFNVAMAVRVDSQSASREGRTLAMWPPVTRESHLPHTRAP